VCGGSFEVLTEENQMSIIIPGDPVGKGRPRFSRSGHARTPKKTKEWEARAAWIARIAWSGEPLVGPVQVVVDVVHKRPQTLMRKKFADGRLVNGSSRQDIDNVCKAVLDAVQGICYHNDNQVHELIAHQWYAARDEEARVEIRVQKVVG